MGDPILSFDNAVSLAEIISILGGGAMLVWRMSKMATRFEFIGKQQAGEIKALREETKQLRVDVEKLNDIMVELAKTEGRMNLIDERMLSQGKRLDESITRFNDWTERVYEERHRQIQARLAK